MQIPLIRKLTPYIPYISTPAAHNGKICPFPQRTPISNVFADNDAVDYYNKGVNLAISGKFEEAIVLFDLAIKYKPELADSYYNKGFALDKLEKFEIS